MEQRQISRQALGHLIIKGTILSYVFYLTLKALNQQLKSNITNVNCKNKKNIWTECNILITVRDKAPWVLWTTSHIFKMEKGHGDLEDPLKNIRNVIFYTVKMEQKTPSTLNS